MSQSSSILSVSVVIPTMNGERTIRECIESIMACDYPGWFEIVVVDGRSTDNAAKVARAAGAAVIAGTGGGRGADLNLGVNFARGDIVAITDDDCVVDKHWLSELEKCFTNPMVAVAGGPDKTYLAGANKSQKVGGHIHDFVRWTASEHAEDAVIGCNCAYRKEILQMVGGFSRIPYGGDDTELHFRIASANYAIRSNPAAVVYHKRRSSITKTLRQFWLYGKGMGLLFHTNRAAMRQRSRMILSAIAGLTLFTSFAVLGLVSGSFIWIPLTLALAYVMTLPVIYFVLVKKSGYSSNLPLFMVAATISMVLYLAAFLIQQLAPTGQESSFTYKSERDLTR